MLCSASPIAVRAVKYSETIFNFKLFEFDVNFPIASFTDKVSGCRTLGSIIVRHGGVDVDSWWAVLAEPSDRCFVIYLRGGGFNILKHSLSAGFLGGIVLDVGLEHGLHFLRGRRRSLSDDGLFS